MITIEIVSISLLTSYMWMFFVHRQCQNYPGLLLMYQRSACLGLILQSLWIIGLFSGWHGQLLAGIPWVWAWVARKNAGHFSPKPSIFLGFFLLICSFCFLIAPSYHRPLLIHTLMANLLLALLLLLFALTSMIMVEAHYLRKRELLPSFLQYFPMQYMERVVFVVTCLSCLLMTFAWLSGYVLQTAVVMAWQKWIPMLFLWLVLLGLFMGQYYFAWRGWRLMLFSWLCLAFSGWIYLSSLGI
jgi:hypothetical protein